MSYAQKKSFKFTHFGKQSGLNQSSVNYIYQDSKGFVWIANFGGINRFDGYEFKSYAHNFNDSTSIADNSVWTILERKDKSLWFGTKTGLSSYQESNDGFLNFVIKDSKDASATLAVKALFEDKKGRFYVGSEGQGLFTFSTESKTFHRVDMIPSQAKVTSITEDTKNNLWVATENYGLFQLAPDRKKVIEFDASGILKSKTIWNVFSEKQFVWIGTDEDGLVRYDLENNALLFFKNKPKNYQYNAGDKIKFITKFQDDVWIASATQGLSYYSQKDQRFYNYQRNPYHNNTLYDNDVSGIFPGQNDALYVGFYTKGFDKLISVPFYSIKNNPKNDNSLSNDNVYSMHTDSDDNLWFGTFGGGLNRYDPRTKKYTHYRHDPNDSSTLSHDWIRIIYEDSKGALWIGTWGGGLNKFDKKTGKSKRYVPDPKDENTLSHNIVTTVFEDMDGTLWIGTYGGGINIYKEATDNFVSITHDANNPNSISDDHITSFYQDQKGTIWICMYGGGLNSYDKKTGRFEHYLPNTKNLYSLNTYKTLHIYKEPKEDYFWITTLGGGINKYYPNEKKFINYTEEDGLSNNSTMGMLRDKNGMYWISSNQGLSRFDPIKETFTNYTTLDGLTSDDYNLEAYAQAKDGTLYFGGKNGITYFKPNEVGKETVFPKVRFTHIEVENKKYNTSLKKIKVPYKKRATFQFAAINPSKSNKVEYAYQLTGQDEEWRILGKNRYLEFTNLDPGNYELRIKSTNGDGIWNTTYSSVTLTVPTPWYLTWYFRCSLILLIALLGYSYYRIKINRVHRQNVLLEKKVEERTQTIHKKNLALNTAKEKIEDAFKELKKLERFKNEFTSMLAHDLKNPLVTILGYSTADSNDTGLKSINKSGKIMLNLIENMLEVQKFENASVKLHLDRVNLRGIIQEALAQMKLLYEEKRIKILINVPAEIMIQADKDIIERVLINLISNAIKFSPTDSTITVFVNVEEKADQVRIGVKDEGPGIPSNQLKHIFTKFSQVEAKKLGMTRSTGLGLTFCKMAIEAHNCSIDVISEINKGSEFYFYLPRLEDSIIEAQENQEQQKKYENPLIKLTLEPIDLKFINKFSKKIDTLTIYETGEWLDIFEELEDKPSENIQKWKQMMMEALTSFDQNAFSYLKNLTTESTK